MDKFILERKPKKVYTIRKYPQISISSEAYEAVVAAAIETGKSLSKIASQALLFALAHVEYIE